MKIFLFILNIKFAIYASFLPILIPYYKKKHVFD